MKIERLVPGQIVYDVGESRMGNTMMKTVSVWRVKIISVDLEAKTVTASWNGNAPRQYGERHIKNWRAKEPTLIRTAMGRHRLATREEIKAAKEG